MAKSLLCGTCLLAALALSLPGAFAGKSRYPTGVTKKTIVIGGTAPLSGPESAYAPVARGAQAYFKYANARKLLRWKIDYRVRDDAYEPAKTVQATRALVQQDRVFAIFNSVGTEHVLAVRPFLNQLGVPQLFVGSGATVLANQRKRYPWTMGYLPSFVGEGAVYGRHIAKTRPRARIAVLAENSEYGDELRRGLQRGLHGKGKIVATQTYEVTDVDVSSQVARLKASRANTFMLFALPKQALQSFIYADKLGWRPRIYITSVSIDPFVMKVARENTGGRATNGAISMAFLKDPTDPRLKRDRGVKLYRKILKRYGSGANPEAVAHFYGMATAFTMVDALRHAGRHPTRKSLLKAATHLKEKNNPFLRRGVTVRTSARDYYPIERVQMLKYKKKRWVPIGAVVRAR